ncbi:alpha/beta hydrolase family protein [Bryobacter aggregatus]|uniref:alpha/beta hydrolase family protein n=1 Tax=Bryobacter aggregatus TaxID=360054 RepID=UPI0006893293|nr:CocE/NonD family hydrolase [Bryobacter aggregatus]
MAPDGRFFSLLNHTPSSLELWIGETATDRLKKIEKAAINASIGDAVEWMPDSRTLLVRLVPPTRGKMPEQPTTPNSPAIQETSGKTGATPTYQDLLKNPHDEELFAYFAQSQLALVNAATGQFTTVGKPALIIDQQPSPDGQHLLVTQIHKPFSYVLTFANFPKEIEVWNRSGLIEYKIASVPMQERIPLGGVSTGPRGVDWNPSETASLYWVEALDGGNPKEKVPNRDRVLSTKAPFKTAPAELIKTKERLTGKLLWSAKGNALIVSDMERQRRWLRTMLIDPKNPSAPAKILNERNQQDRYRNPGTFLTQTLPNGQRVLAESGGYFFLTGDGASAEGDRPFLDRLDPVTGKTERLFQCDADHYETVVALLSDDGSRFLTRRESPTQVPNFFIRDNKGSLDTFTNFADPAPQLRGITKQLVKYKRADGVDLSFTLYLPPGYKQGTRLPTVVWAYPVEFTDGDTAGQISGSTKRFTSITGYSHLFFLLEGYAILDGATIPIVGSPDEANNTYVEQLTTSAKAAIDKAVAMGVTDPDRVGVGGHSYGAFMTANLLAHTGLASPAPEPTTAR